MSTPNMALLSTRLAVDNWDGPRHAEESACFLCLDFPLPILWSHIPDRTTVSDASSKMPKHDICLMTQLHLAWVPGSASPGQTWLLDLAGAGKFVSARVCRSTESLFFCLHVYICFMFMFMCNLNMYDMGHLKSKALATDRTKALNLEGPTEEHQIR